MSRSKRGWLVCKSHMKEKEPGDGFLFLYFRIICSREHRIMGRNERSEGFILLHLLLGRAGSGKTVRLRNLLKETPVEQQPVLLVPEQGSFPK